MTTASVLVLAVLDSINPSAIVVTLYLLSTAGSRALTQVGVYVATIFVTYLLLGVVMMLGIGALLPSLGAALDGQPGFILQSVMGLALVIYSVRATATSEPAPAVRPPSAGTYAALVALGISVTVMELPTAVPYFAAIGLMSEAGWRHARVGPAARHLQRGVRPAAGNPADWAPRVAGSADAVVCGPPPTAGARCARDRALGGGARRRRTVRDGPDRAGSAAALTAQLKTHCSGAFALVFYGRVHPAACGRRRDIEVLAASWDEFVAQIVREGARSYFGGTTGTKPGKT